MTSYKGMFDKAYEERVKHHADERAKASEGIKDRNSDILRRIGVVYDALKSVEESLNSFGIKMRANGFDPGDRDFRKEIMPVDRVLEPSIILNQRSGDMFTIAVAIGKGPIISVKQIYPPNNEEVFSDVGLMINWLAAAIADYRQEAGETG